jgi:hypothetical protein
MEMKTRYVRVRVRVGVMRRVMFVNGDVKGDVKGCSGVSRKGRRSDIRIGEDEVKYVVF